MPRFNLIDYICLILIIIGAINWGLIGFFDYDLVSSVFGVGRAATRTVFALVGLTGLYAISFFWRRAADRGGRAD